MPCQLKRCGDLLRVAVNQNFRRLRYHYGFEFIRPFISGLGFAVYCRILYNGLGGLGIHPGFGFKAQGSRLRGGAACSGVV